MQPLANTTPHADAAWSVSAIAPDGNINTPAATPSSQSLAMIFNLVSSSAMVALALAADNPWATYPSVPHTASINGFADRIYDQLPSCAQPCVKRPANTLPCPYWDTGCLCIMSPWVDPVADCIAQNCKGDDVNKARSLATSACKKAGVWDPYWIPGSKQTQELEAAAKETAAAASSAPASSAPASTSQQAASSAAPAQSLQSAAAPAASSSAAAAPGSSAPASSAAAQSSAAPASSAAAAPGSSAPASSAAAHSSVAAQSVAAPSGAHSSAPPAVQSANGANGVYPAAALGVAAGLALLI